MALDLRDLSMDKTPRYQQDELDFGVNYMKMCFFCRRMNGPSFNAKSVGIRYSMDPSCVPST